MWFTNRFKPRNSALVPVLILTALSGCISEGVKLGSVEHDFQGLDKATVLSPTAIRLDWTADAKYSSYEVYADYSTGPVTTRIFDNATIEDLSPETNYVFSVVAVLGDERFGFDKETLITTWPRFTGVEGVTLNENNELVVTWDYPYEGVEFQVFYVPWENPSALNTSNWTTHRFTTTEQVAVFKDLPGSTRYHFAVHAKYPDTSVERPTTTLTGTTPSTFPTPTYYLPDMVIGSLPFVIIEPVINAMYSAANYTSQVFKYDPETEESDAVTDPLVGQGTLVFSSAAGLTRGPVDNLSVSVSYDDGTLDETIVFDGLSTYIKASSPYLDLPPIPTAGAGPAFLGKSMASGDFNCDGYQDLAVGMPDASLGQVGVNNQDAGAVYVYYSYRKTDGTYELKLGLPSLEPAALGADPQIITFDDLPAGARFGTSLASDGNLNGDTLGGNQCDDLLVGAPHGSNGMAFVFFGSRKGLQSPRHMAEFPRNTETCDGKFEDATCSAVMLTPAYSQWPSSYLGGSFSATNLNWDAFGVAVSFIGDFNADGYDDLAVGAPNGDWDGVINSNNDNLRDVGYVAVFFGSQYGIGYETPTATGVPTLTDPRFRFLKIYPPFPQADMSFGASLSGGADVDGGFRVRHSNGSYYGGSDFVVGAPGFRYNNPEVGALGITGSDPDSYKGIPPVGGGWQPTALGAGRYSAGTSYYGFPQNNGGGSATGAAFVYFGRTNGAVAETNIEVPSRANFWKCGRRGMVSSTTHFSCLVNPDGFRILFPRQANNSGFGSAVAMLGNSSRYDTSNAGIPNTSFIDPNKDGFAEIAVAARYANSAMYSNTGAIWQFFGNADRYYEADHFYNLFGDTDPTSDWVDNDPNCDQYVTQATDQINCPPTKINPNSVSSGAQMGATAHSLSADDMTGDGILDLIVGAPYDSTAGTNAGAVMIFTSNVSKGLTANFKKVYNSAATVHDRLGYAVAAGNFDGSGGLSGYLDLAAGAPFEDSERVGGGALHIFNSGTLPLPAIKPTSDISVYDELASLQSYGYHRTKLVGDINGDGYDDAATRMKRYNSQGTEVYDLVIYYGSPLGLVTTTFCLKNMDDVFISGSGGDSDCYPAGSHEPGITNFDILLPQMITKPNNVGSYWANRVWPAGDINGDGFADLLVEESVISDVSTGSLTAYFGTRGGIQTPKAPAWVPTTNDPQLVTKVFVPRPLDTDVLNPTQSSGYAQNSRPLAVGDFNGDGYDDLAVSDAHASSPSMPGGWDCSGPPPTHPATISACGGALNGGANGRSVEGHGIVYIIHGGKDGYQTPQVQGTGADFATNDPSTTITIYDTETDPTTLGACGDGDDPICKGMFIRNPVFPKVGSPTFDNLHYGWGKLAHHFGMSITVIDFNNDGYDDLLVGAPGFEDIVCHSDPNNPSNYGRIFIYRGTANGLVAPDEHDFFAGGYTMAAGYNATQSCPLGDSPGTPNVANDVALATARNAGATVRALQPPIARPNLLNNKGSRYFGGNFTVAGDLNGDGYEDLVVAVDRESVDPIQTAGTAYIYYGPLCGADNDSPMFFTLENNLNKQLTYGTAPLDTVVAGPDCTIGGLFKPAPQKIYVKDASSGHRYGRSIAGSRKGKADVNGDGYDDFLIGTHRYSDPITGATNIGRGVIYFGSVKGIYAAEYPAATVVRNANNQYNPYSLKPSLGGSNSMFFEELVSVGDVNGDGTADYMISSRPFDGIVPVKGVDLGAFFLFY